MKHSPERYAAAVRYAAADKSDPFCLARCYAHMRNKVCGFNQSGQDAFYSADAYSEERVTADGKSYIVTSYRNIVRP